MLEGTVTTIDARWQLAAVAFDGGVVWIADSGLVLGQRVRIRVLGRDVSLALQAAERSSIQNSLACTVIAISPGGHPSQAMVDLACGGSRLVALITGRAVEALQLAPGMEVWAQVKAAALVR